MVVSALVHDFFEEEEKTQIMAFQEEARKYPGLLDHPNPNSSQVLANRKRMSLASAILLP